MDSSRSVQACVVELITYSLQGCPDNENRKKGIYRKIPGGSAGHLTSNPAKGQEDGVEADSQDDPGVLCGLMGQIEEFIPDGLACFRHSSRRDLLKQR